MTRPETMTDNRNTILAVILSGLVLIAWQYFYNVPQMERQRAQSQTQAELQQAAAADGAGIDDTPDPRRDQPQLGAIRHHARRPAGRGCARRQPRRRDRGLAAHQDRDAARFGQHLAEGRAHRRPVAGASSATPSIRPRPRSCCFRRRTPPHPYYAEFGWVAGRRLDGAAARPRTRCGSRRAPAA